MSGKDGWNHTGDEGQWRHSSGKMDPAREKVPAQGKAMDRVRELPGGFPEEERREGRSGAARAVAASELATLTGEEEEGLRELGAEVGETLEE